MDKLSIAEVLAESAEVLRRQERDLEHACEKLAIHEGYFRLLNVVNNQHRGMTDRCQSHAGYLAGKAEKFGAELFMQYEREKPAVSPAPECKPDVGSSEWLMDQARKSKQETVRVDMGLDEYPLDAKSLGTTL